MPDTQATSPDRKRSLAYRIAGKFRGVYISHFWQNRESLSTKFTYSQNFSCIKSIVKQGSLVIMALLKNFWFSQGLFLILNAACQAQWDHRKSTVTTKRCPPSLHPIPAPRIGLRAAHTWSYHRNRRLRLLYTRWSQGIGEQYRGSPALISRKVQSGGEIARKYRKSDWRCQYKMLPNCKQGCMAAFV